MPYLRVVRDKRGYETTYLLHAARDGARPRSVVMYAFRSPGGVRVGRQVLEPELRREIEARRPDVHFDWHALVANQQFVDLGGPSRPKRRGPQSGSSEAPSVPPAPRHREPAPPPKLLVPVAIEGETAEQRMRFLAHWHGILCEQLPTRVTDSARRDALMLLVDRLNPAGWLEPDEISQGLQDGADALEQLSKALAKRRRKGRRGKARAVQGEPASDARGGAADEPNEPTSE